MEVGVSQKSNLPNPPSRRGEKTAKIAMLVVVSNCGIRD